MCNIDFVRLIISLFPLQSKCPIDALDGSGKAALHHAGERLGAPRVNQTKVLLSKISLLRTWENVLWG